MSGRPTNRYELFTCGWRGHVLVGTDVAEVTEADRAIVRQTRLTCWGPGAARD